MFINASVPQHEELCNTSFQCCGKDVEVISPSKIQKSVLTLIEAHKTSFHILSALLV